MFVTSGVSMLHPYVYKNRRAKDTISRMSSPTGLLVEGSVYRNLLEQGFDLSPERDNKSEYDPQSMFTALEKYAQPQEVVIDDAIWNQAYDVTVKAFCDDHFKVKPDSSIEGFKSSIKGEKSSGAPEFASKKDVFDKDLARMYRWIEGKKAPDPCVAYHRVQHGKEGPKQRLVWGYPQSVTLAEGMFARPLINYYLSVRSPMAIGRHRYKLSARMVPMLNAHVKYGFDFSAFDASIGRRLILMAFSVLRKQLDFSDEFNFKAWNLVKYYFIDTPILMPDGLVYTKHRGVPSGSYFTQLVDSVVNYFCIQYATIVLQGMAINPDRILVLGDDSLFSYPRLVSVRRYAEVLKDLGLKLNVDKTDVTVGEGSVQFLGHTWVHGLVDRDPLDIAKRMAFPERRSKIRDPRVRVIHRVYPYVCDALSAHKIIGEYAWPRGKPIETYSRVGQMLEGAGIGWKEYLNTLDEGTRNDFEFLILAYLGILK